LKIKEFLRKSKVFRYFKKLIIVVNLKNIITIIIGIGIIGIVIGGAIEFNSEREGVPWREGSGPFQIEKYEYYLGEKIFLNAVNIPADVSGEIIFFRPAVDVIKNPKEYEGIPGELISKKIKYMGIEFDGESKQNFNRYFEPRFNEWKGICSTDKLVGEWIMVFSGTQYEPIHFTILNYTMPGDTRSFEPLVDIGNC
jgi:hypothetical protein